VKRTRSKEIDPAKPEPASDELRIVAGTALFEVAAAEHQRDAPRPWVIVKRRRRVATDEVVQEDAERLAGAEQIEPVDLRGAVIAQDDRTRRPRGGAGGGTGTSCGTDADCGADRGNGAGYAGGTSGASGAYSHSIVPGGLLVMS
jgi:hypothetical protein